MLKDFFLQSPGYTARKEHCILGYAADTESFLRRFFSTHFCSVRSEYKDTSVRLIKI